MDKDSKKFLSIMMLTFLGMQLSQYLFNKFTGSPSGDGEAASSAFAESEAHPFQVIDDILVTKEIEVALGLQKLIFDSKTGAIIEVKLLDQFTTAEHDDYIKTLFKKPSGEQVLSSDLLIFSNESEDVQPEDFNKVDFVEGNDYFDVVKTSERIQLIERYTVGDPYVLNKTVLIKNTSEKEIENIFYYSELKNSKEALIDGSKEGSRMFHGAGYYTSDDKYKKFAFSSFKDSSLEAKKPTWFAVTQRYFSTGVFSKYPGKLYTRNSLSSKSNYVGHISAPINLEAHSQIDLSQKIYSGPEIKEKLEKFAPGFEHVIDYGFFWAVSAFLMKGLEFCFALTSNWGLAIILLTLALRTSLQAVLSPLTAKTMANAKKMQELQPRIDALKTKYANDQMGLYQATNQVYKENNINVLSGLLLTLTNVLIQVVVQLPILVGFYSLLMESFSLRQSSLMDTWLLDLSLPDPLFIIPIVVTITGYIQVSFTPKPQDQNFQLFFRILPIMLGLFSLKMPAAVGLYFVVNNIFSILNSLVTKRGNKT
jgi:YidC/Oxa1 family membrane protein insertase